MQREAQKGAKKESNTLTSKSIVQQAGDFYIADTSFEQSFVSPHTQAHCCGSASNPVACLVSCLREHNQNGIENENPKIVVDTICPLASENIQNVVCSSVDWFVCLSSVSEACHVRQRSHTRSKLIVGGTRPFPDGAAPCGQTCQTANGTTSFCPQRHHRYSNFGIRNTLKKMFTA